MSAIVEFVRESNRIEGITRDPTEREVIATMEFIDGRMSFDSVIFLQLVFAPCKPLRDRLGMDVQVGDYVAPPGGPDIHAALRALITTIRNGVGSPWHAHIEFERLHPFMDGNGRTGRAIWAWHMRAIGQDPFALPFLHRFYYQTLANQ